MKHLCVSKSILLCLAFNTIGISYAMEETANTLLSLSLLPNETESLHADLAMCIQKGIEMGVPVNGAKISENVFFVPLIIGATYKDPKMVEWLLARGASRAVCTEYYRSPIHAVLNISRTAEEIPDLQEEWIAYYLKRLPHSQEAIIITQLLGELPLIRAAQLNNERFARRCLQYGLNPNAQDDHGRTALMCAVENNAIGVVKALFEYGVDITVTDKKARTAADYAKRNFNSELKKKLTMFPACKHTGIPLQYLDGTPEEIAFADQVHKQYNAQQTMHPTELNTSLPMAALLQRRLPTQKKQKKASRRKTTKRSTYKGYAHNNDDEEFVYEEEASQESPPSSDLIRPESIKQFKKTRSKN